MTGTYNLQLDVGQCFGLFLVMTQINLPRCSSFVFMIHCDFLGGKDTSLPVIGPSRYTCIYIVITRHILTVFS